MGEELGKERRDVGRRRNQGKSKKETGELGGRD